MSEDNEKFKTELDEFKKAIDAYINKLEKSFNINRNWDIGLTTSAIVFTLLTAVTGTLGESKLLSEAAQKLLTGTFGAIAVAVQSASSQFPVRARAKISEQQRKKLLSLKVKTINNFDELETAKLDYDKILQIEDY